MNINDKVVMLVSETAAAKKTYSKIFVKFSWNAQKEIKNKNQCVFISI